MGPKSPDATDLHLFQFLQNVLETVTLTLIASLLVVNYFRT